MKIDYGFVICLCGRGDGGIKKCGCSNIRCFCLLDWDLIIHWLGMHWNVVCAMYEAAKLLKQYKTEE